MVTPLIACSVNRGLSAFQMLANVVNVPCQALQYRITHKQSPLKYIDSVPLTERTYLFIRREEDLRITKLKLLLARE